MFDQETQPEVAPETEEKTPETDETAEESAESKEGIKEKQSEEKEKTKDDSKEKALDLLNDIQKEQVKKLQEQKRKHLSEQIQLQSSIKITEEKWTKKEAESGLSADLINSIAKTKISEKVDERFKEWGVKLKEYGITGSNEGILKESTSEIIYDYFTKNGQSEEKTEKYVDDELSPKLETVFSKMDDLMKKYHLESVLKTVEKFSTFSKLNILKDGKVEKSAVIKLLLADQESLKKLTDYFDKYLDLDNKNTELDNQLNTILKKDTSSPAPESPEKTKSPDEKTDSPAPQDEKSTTQQAKDEGEKKDETDITKTVKNGIFSFLFSGLNGIFEKYKTESAKKEHPIIAFFIPLFEKFLPTKEKK